MIRTNVTLLALFALSAGLGAVGCRQEAHPPAEATAAPPASAAPEPVSMQTAHTPSPGQGQPGPLEPGQMQSGQLPPGHPPIDGAAPVAAAAPSAGGELTWTAPMGWESMPPANNMRRAQYRVPAPTGDAELVVFYFGPGQGGDAQSNAERWASQFLDERGQPATASLKTRPLEANGIAITVVEARGAYQSGSMMGSQTVESKPGYALLGAIAAGRDANWFFKLTGPEATVEAQRGAFEEMLRSLRPAA